MKKIEPKILFYIFWSIGWIFNAVMDAIAFHPISWLVKLDPEFMQIKDCPGIWGCWDGWHVSKIIAGIFIALSIYYAYKAGWEGSSTFNLYLKNRRFLLMMAILGASAFIIHWIFLHKIFI